MKTTVEMTGYGRRGKPNAGFPQRPQPLEIAAQFPHSHRRDEAVESGKPKAGFPLSTAVFSLVQTNSERRPGGAASLLLQAHCSIRKCWWTARRASGPDGDCAPTERSQAGFPFCAPRSSVHPDRMDRKAPAYRNSETIHTTVSGHRSAM
jgi:hypothetical protein